MKRLIIALVFLASLCAEAQERWVGTWAAAIQETPEKFMPQTTLSNVSLRQTVMVSIGGEKVRVKLSNIYGKTALRIGKVYIATAEDSCYIDTASAYPLTFTGREEVSIEPGKEVFSDAATFSLKPLQKLSITIYYAESPTELSCHNGSFSTSFLAKGLSSPSERFNVIESVNHWYNIAAVEVYREGATAIAILGNSITDGHGATMNAFSTWPDVLARHLRERNIGVLNLGIGANCVVRERGLGEPAIRRFNRDILSQQGLQAIVVFQGVNDIGTMKGDTTLCSSTIENLIAAYREFIKKAHSKGIKVYGATITPFRKSKYFKPGHEDVRRAVNSFIRNSGEFDGVIDFDLITRNPKEPLQLKSEYQCGDWLHPNDTGYQAMGEYAAKRLASLLKE